MAKLLEKRTVRTKGPSGKEHEVLVNDQSKLHESFEVGDVAFQGDVILVRIAALPESAKRRKNRQIAEGTSRGSRHVVRRGEVYNCAKSDVVAAVKQATGKTVKESYVGPVFVSPAAPTADDLDHPEHGNHGFPAGSVIACLFQRSLTKDNREIRMAD